LKVLHVLPTLSPSAGGVPTVVSGLVEAQAEAGIEAVVATTNVDTPSGVYHRPGWDKLANGTVPVFYGEAQVPKLMASLSLANYLRKAIPDFDVVHVHGLYRFPNTAAAYWSRRHGVPYIVVPHGTLDPYLHKRSSSSALWAKRLHERLFALPNLNSASAIHYTAEEERELASFLKLRSPSFVVPNGLDWERFRSLPERGELRVRWGIGDAPLVLFLGRLHFKKGLDLLVPAFDVVRKAKPNARLVIAGPENDGHGQEVRRWVSERGLDSAVHFVGPLEGLDVVRAFVDADVFALPSYTENFGMAVIEAMACALPVVISDQVNIHHEISQADAGLVTHCDVDEVAAALLNLLDDPDRRRTMGKAGRQLVREHYAWPGIVAALSQEYEVVVRQRRNSLG
jgi:glycosyltransferase involved in cell wall biosynthesis